MYLFGRYNMKCDNCRGHNGHVIKCVDISGEVCERHVLCPACHKIFEHINNEYEDIVSVQTN